MFFVSVKYSQLIGSFFFLFFFVCSSSFPVEALERFEFRKGSNRDICNNNNIYVRLVIVV